MQPLPQRFLNEVTPRLEQLATSGDGPIQQASTLIADAIESGGVVHAFGTGHSEAFAMEIAGRAGGLIPTSKIALRDVVLRGTHQVAELGSPALERDPNLVDELFDLHPRNPSDIYLIASNSGVNGSIVGMALKVKEHGHRLIAVTSLAHTMAVQPKHPSGKRLCEIADVVIDNLAPFGDTTIELSDQLKVGAVSSLTSAFIAQLITISVCDELRGRGIEPPMYISANVPGGDEHNDALLARYAGRLQRDA